jgi:hypothetical protein
MTDTCMKFLDWLYSEYFPIGGRSLPTYPRWLCWLLTGHSQTLHWGDYLNDVSGIRCRCGLKETERHD